MKLKVSNQYEIYQMKIATWDVVSQRTSIGVQTNAELLHDCTNQPVHNTTNQLRFGHMKKLPTKYENRPNHNVSRCCIYKCGRVSKSITDVQTNKLFHDNDNRPVRVWRCIEPARIQILSTICSRPAQYKCDGPTKQHEYGRFYN